MFGFFGRPAASNMEEARKSLESDKNIILIDVRSKNEHRSGHIKGAVNLPLDEMEKMLVLFPDKSAKYFVHCQSGGRSQTAVRYMKRQGYSDATNIGGISAWQGKLEK